MTKPGPKPGSKRKNTAAIQPAKKRVGRPPKSTSKDAQAAPKRRGRPPKSAAKSGTDSAPDTAPKRRGRPSKAKAAAAEQSEQQHEQQQAQEPEQAQSSQVLPEEAIVLEVVGTSIQPAFVIQEHGVNSPDTRQAEESKDTSSDKPEGVLSKLPSKKQVANAKKLAVKKTQAMKKTASKKAADVAEAASDAAAEMEHQTSTWGNTIWNTVTAPVSIISSGIRRLSGRVEPHL